jgi:uncharacterized oxidoreductase
MLNFTVDQLHELGTKILSAAGVPVEDADTVAAELAEANRVGHDSHGVMRLVQYVQMIQDGHIHPGAPIELLSDLPTLAVYDAHLNLGQVAAKIALETAIAKAKEHGTATVFIRNCNHVGRLGAYTERAAREGFFAMMSVNSPGPGGVAPFGGIDRKLGTNPICMAAPYDDAPIVLDMTTSATAEGKLRVAFQSGDRVGEGLLIDGHGAPSINPADFYNEPFGAILPLGGSMGHKGFGLAVMIDILCGILSGSGVARKDLPRGANGVWLHLIQIERLLPMTSYNAWMATYVDHLKQSRRQSGVTEILLPGEIEQRRKAVRDEEGIAIPDETWRLITETAARVGADV